MPADVATVRAKVQAILTERAMVSIDKDGDYSFEMGSTRVFVRVVAHPNGEATLISVFAPVLFNVPLSPEFFEFIARNTDALIFGHIILTEGQDARHGNLMVVHKLLGDYVDGDELLYAAYGVAGAADSFDDDLKAKFGGDRFSDL
jgi:hypothetical protein